MPINECCNTSVVCCEFDDSIQKVAALMREHHIGDVVVVVKKEDSVVPIGIITDRDIVLKAIAQEANLNTYVAGDLMSNPLVTVCENDGFVETLRLMRQHKLRRMPVATATGDLFGIVTVDDIIKLLTMEMSLVADAMLQQPGKEHQQTSDRQYSISARTPIAGRD